MDRTSHLHSTKRKKGELLGLHKLDVRIVVLLPPTSNCTYCMY